MSEQLIPIGTYKGTAVAQGGFGRVYRVALPDGRPAALKWIDATADDGARRSLQHEFNVHGTLHHPQLPKVRDFGIADGRPFLVIDWIDGRSPTECSEDECDFGSLLRHLARVLWFVHRRGWVHGDLKPENLRWGLSNGEPLLYMLDFGLARPIGDDSRPRGAGTVGYCAPEFLNLQSADGRADWYSTGVILYEWLFGTRPFASDEPATEIAGHLETRPDLTRTPRRRAPAWAADVVARLLAKSPDERGADEWDLLDWISQYEPSVDPARLLNHDLQWHLSSGMSCLSDAEKAVVETIVDTLESGAVSEWRIGTQLDDPGRLARFLISRLSAGGWSIADAVNLLDPDLARQGRSNDAPIKLDASRIEAGRSLRASVSVAPLPIRDAELGTPPVGLHSACINLLPWDGNRVHDFLRGLTGEDETVRSLADDMLLVTGGLPAAISALTNMLIDTSAMYVGDRQWSVDETAVLAWPSAEAARLCFDRLIGALPDDQRQLCLWLALGRGYGCSSLLPVLATDNAGPLQQTIGQLESRGIVVMNRLPEQSGSLDMRLRIPACRDAILAGLSADDRRQKAAALADRMSEHPCAPADLYHEILARCWADADELEKSSEQFVQCAAIAVASDERQRAGRLIADAERVAESIPDARVRAYWYGRARMVRADRLKAAGEIDGAGAIYRELLAVGRHYHDRHLLAETLSDLGDLYRQTRRFEKGIRVLRRARLMWGEIGDRERESRATMNLGNMYWVSSDLTRAQQFYENALVIQRELGSHKLAATTLSNLGAIHLFRYEYDAAETCFRESYAEHDRLNVPVEKARTLNNLGGIEFLRGRLDTAEQYFLRAADLNQEAGAQAEEVFNHRNLVEVALERGDLRSVVTRGSNVHGVARDLGDIATAAEVGILLAEGYLRAGDFRRARQYLDDVQQACRTITNVDLAVQAAMLSAAFPLRLGQNRIARDLLDSSCPHPEELSNRHLRLDLTILRMRLALREENPADVDTLWNTIQQESHATGTPHKLALAVCVRLLDSPHDDVFAGASGMIDAFLGELPQWHWVGEYLTWKAQDALRRGDTGQAESFVADAVSRLRRDGNWDALWRALGVAGEIAHARTDYEPAVTAFDEALRILQAIGRTIDDEAGRDSYGRHPMAVSLTRSRERIMELVG